MDGGHHQARRIPRAVGRIIPTAPTLMLTLAAVSLAGCAVTPSAGDTTGPAQAPRATTRIGAHPTIDELSSVQGFAFQEDATWTDLESTAAQWVATTPDVAQAKLSGVRALQAVEPAACEPVALLAGYGLTIKRSDPSYLAEVGYGRMRSNSWQAYPTQASVDEWQSTSYRLPAGQAQEWAGRIPAAWEDCSTFTVVEANGKRRNAERAHNLTAERGWTVHLANSGHAVIRSASLDGPVGAQLVTVVEPIGDVLQLTRIGIWSKDPVVWQRASEVYNQQADEIAGGRARPRVDVGIR